MVGIYKIINPKGKIYVGQSTHIAKREINYGYIKKANKQPKISRSIVKYGFENHQFEIIEECSIEQLNERETFWKIYYLELVNNDWNEVLFCGLYDNGGGPLSDETKLKISLNSRGRKLSESQLSSYGQKQPKNKKPCSEERKEKIKYANLGRKVIHEDDHKHNYISYRKILQYDLENNFIKEWDSTNDIKDIFRNGTNIYSLYKNLQGGKNTAYGYIWKWKDEPEVILNQPINNSGEIKVYQFNRQGELIQEWNSILEAAISLSIEKTSISACSLGKIKSAGGFIWKRY